MPWQTGPRCEQCAQALPAAAIDLAVLLAGMQAAAYRKRLSVTASVTPTPADQLFRYVLHADVPRFEAEGWLATQALDGTHHGEYSVLMRQIEQG